MSKTGKVLLALIVVLVLVILIGYFATPKGSYDPDSYQNPIAQTAPADLNTDGSTDTEVSADTSNAGLEEDLSGIDSLLNGLDSDNSDLNASLNDKPIDQLQ